MENRNNILNELREISPAVANIGCVVPYQVPTGYFDNLANNLLQRVKGEAVELSPALQQANSNPYEAPQGYFEGLAGNILQRIKAEATVESSPVLQQARNNPYQVPPGYFDTLADNILQRVKEAETMLSAALQQANTNPYTVPQGYFDSLPAIILNRVKANKTDDATNELETLSPLLSSIGKKMPFSTPEGYFDDMETLSPLMNGLRRCYVYEVPAGYFDQLPAQILKAVKAQQPAKVIAMSFTRKVIRLAAAAVVAGLIVTAGLMFLNNPKTGSDTNNVVAVAAAGELDNISDEMLEKYLENQTSTTPETPLAATVAVDELNASDMKDLLADVTDADLQQYLEKYSTVKDIQTN